MSRSTGLALLLPAELQAKGEVFKHNISVVVAQRCFCLLVARGSSLGLTVSRTQGLVLQAADPQSIVPNSDVSPMQRV